MCPLRQCLRGLDEHPVGELRVGTETGRVRYDPAIVAVDHWGEVHLPVPGLDLGDVREPLLVRRFGREVAVDEVAGRELYLRRLGTCAVRPSSAMILRITFFETPVWSVALILRYPYLPLDAANASATSVLSPAYLSMARLAW